MIRYAFVALMFILLPAACHRTVDHVQQHYTSYNDNGGLIPPFMYAVPGGFIPGYGERGGYGEGIQSREEQNLQDDTPSDRISNNWCPRHLICTPRRLS